jgi:hypothetical protein
MAVLSLDDVLKAPTDPELLSRHLETLGLVPPAPQPVTAASTPPVAVKPMSLPVLPTDKTRDPRVELSPLGEMTGRRDATTVTADPTGAGGGATSATPISGGIAPMVKPTELHRPDLLNAPRASLESFKSREAEPANVSRIAPVGEGPQVLQPGTSDYEQNLRARQEDERLHPWGTPENHPGLLGKIGHIAGRIGNIAGDIVAPGTMSLIPGTDLYKRGEAARTEARMEKEKAGETAATKEKSEGELRSAEAEKNKAQAHAALHPEEAIGKTPDEHALAARERILSGKGTPEDQATWDAFADLKKVTQEVKPPTATELSEKMIASDNALRNDPASLKPEQRDELAAHQRKDASAKIPEEIRAKIDEAPVPADKKYPLGYSDPQYHADLAKWIKGYDAALKQTPQALATQAQRDFNATMKLQAMEIQRKNQEDREDKEARTLVRWTDPKTDRTAVTSVGEAKKAGATDLQEVAGPEKVAIQDARAAYHLLNKKGKEVADKGVFQLIDEVEKAGQLGVLSTRMNAWLAGGVGTQPGDDPRFNTLLDKAELAMTLTMKAHFGVSGGRSPQMLQHFLDMANARKMDAGALRAGFGAVNNYMTDKAELPSKEGGPGGVKGGATATPAAETPKPKPKTAEEYLKQRGVS